MDFNHDIKPNVDEMNNNGLSHLDDKGYEHKCRKLMQRIEEYKLENERLLHHICDVKKLISKNIRQKSALRERLANYDNGCHLNEPHLKPKES